MRKDKRTDKVSKAVEEQKLFAIMRTGDPAKALAAAEAVIDAGLKLIKVTMTVPDAPRILEKLAARGDVVVGAGSVTTMRETVEMISRGACFIVCPFTDRTIIDYCRDNDVFVAAGGLTPTEVMVAYLAGVDLVKVYPVSALGGSTYIRELLTPMPFLKLLAVGGVRLPDVAGYIEAGATAVGASWPLIPPETLERGDTEAIRKRAADFLSALREARNSGSQGER